VQPRDYLIVKDGILNDLQTTREQAPWLADWYRSRGEAGALARQLLRAVWADVQFQRMPNINLLPHPDRDVPLEELIDGVENGILIDGSGSFSIDQQRYNAQFGGQVFREIRNGRSAGMLKDVAYQIRTPEFWNSMDLLGGPSTYFMGGTFGDGKGQPAQSNASRTAACRRATATSRHQHRTERLTWRHASVPRRGPRSRERVLSFSTADAGAGQHQQRHARATPASPRTRSARRATSPTRRSRSRARSASGRVGDDEPFRRRVAAAVPCRPASGSRGWSPRIPSTWASSANRRYRRRMHSSSSPRQPDARGARAAPSRA
jgi:hypothetical protein